LKFVIGVWHFLAPIEYVLSFEKYSVLITS